LGRDLEGAKITMNEYLDRWLETYEQEYARKRSNLLPTSLNLVYWKVPPRENGTSLDEVLVVENMPINATRAGEVRSPVACPEES